MGIPIFEYISRHRVHYNLKIKPNEEYYHLSTNFDFEKKLPTESDFKKLLPLTKAVVEYDSHDNNLYDRYDNNLYDRHDNNLYDFTFGTIVDKQNYDPVKNTPIYILDKATYSFDEKLRKLEAYCKTLQTEARRRLQNEKKLKTLHDEKILRKLHDEKILRKLQELRGKSILTKEGEEEDRKETLEALRMKGEIIWAPWKLDDLGIVEIR